MYMYDSEEPFQPDAVNTATFYLLLTMHISTFIANYEGAPWAPPLLQNKNLKKMLLGSSLLLLLLLLQLAPFLNQTLELVLFTDTSFLLQLYLLIAADLVAPWLFATACKKAAAFRQGPLKPLSLQQQQQQQLQQQLQQQRQRRH